MHGGQPHVPGGPPRPRAGLQLPSLAVAWSPPVATAGDSEALAAALASHPAVELVVGPTLAGMEPRLTAAIVALSPKTTVTGTRTAEQAALVVDAGPLQAVREPGPGRPRYRAEGLRIKETWSGHHDPKASAVVSVDVAAVDLAAWRALPSAQVGGCEPAIRALAEAQEQGLAQLEGFLNHADALLWEHYSAQLQAFLPEIKQELQRYASAEAAAGEQQACGRAYWNYVKPLIECTTPEKCGVAPRVVLSAGGARIAAPEPALTVSDRCPMLVGRDYVSELRQLGLDAAEAATAGLDPSWSTLADRLGTIAEVHASLEDVCSPRRWRFAAADLEDMRGRLARIGDALASPELARPEARWKVEPGTAFVPGAGQMRTLARFDAGEGSINRTIEAEAAALREFVLARAACRSGHDPKPLSVLVADASDGKARLLALLYAEELACGDLPPLVK